MTLGLIAVGPRKRQIIVFEMAVFSTLKKRSKKLACRYPSYVSDIEKLTPPHHLNVWRFREEFES